MHIFREERETFYETISGNSAPTAGAPPGRMVRRWSRPPITSLTHNGTINFNGHTITLADGTVLSK